METVDLIIFMNSVATNYREMKQPSAERVCKATLKKVVEFTGSKAMSFQELDKVWVKSFEEYLKRRLSDNSVSTYLRMLQTVYNRAVYEEVVLFTPQLFSKVFKGRASSRSRALTQQDFQTIAEASVKALPGTARVCDFLLLMFYLRGLPFVDLLHLRRCNLQGNRLTYRRQKTKKQMAVLVEPRAMEIIERYQNTNPASPYLFPFLSDINKDEQLQYESALHQFNKQLKCAGVLLGITIPLTSYCARHTWASFANFCKIDKKLISEAMGHSSVQVTEIYFKENEEEEIGKMNQQVIVYALGK